MRLHFLRRRKFGLTLAAIGVNILPTFASPAVGIDDGARLTGIADSASLVYNHNFPDPSILVVGHTYFAYSTNSDGKNVPVIESHDLVHWHAIGDVMSVLPSWASEGYIWSPSVSPAPSGGYQLFFSAYDESEGVMCLGRST